MCVEFYNAHVRCRRSVCCSDINHKKKNVLPCVGSVEIQIEI